jgi:hypothetical protein
MVAIWQHNRLGRCGQCGFTPAAGKAENSNEMPTIPTQLCAAKAEAHSRGRNRMPPACKARGTPGKHRPLALRERQAAQDRQQPAMPLLRGGHRWRYWLAASAVSAVLGLCVWLWPIRLHGQLPTREEADASGSDTAEAREGRADPVELLREGTQLTDAAGHFKLSGNRVVFVLADGARVLTVLENLNLERIAQMARDDGQRVAWTVSGLVTEYQGANYLLVSRAKRRSAALRRAKGTSGELTDEEAENAPPGVPGAGSPSGRTQRRPPGGPAKER